MQQWHINSSCCWSCHGSICLLGHSGDIADRSTLRPGHDLKVDLVPPRVPDYPPSKIQPPTHKVQTPASAAVSQREGISGLVNIHIQYTYTPERRTRRMWGVSNKPSMTVKGDCPLRSVQMLLHHRYDGEPDRNVGENYICNPPTNLQNRHLIKCFPNSQTPHIIKF